MKEKEKIQFWFDLIFIVAGAGDGGGGAFFMANNVEKIEDGHHWKIELYTQCKDNIPANGLVHNNIASW